MTSPLGTHSHPRRYRTPSSWVRIPSLLVEPEVPDSSLLLVEPEVPDSSLLLVAWRPAWYTGSFWPAVLTWSKNSFHHWTGARERSRALDAMNRKPSQAELISGNGARVATLNGPVARFVVFRTGSGCPSPSFSRRNSGRRER